MGIPVESYDRRDLRFLSRYKKRCRCRLPSSASRPRILSLFPTKLLRATLTVIGGTCGTMLLHTEKSNANPCLSYLSDHIQYQRFGIIQHQSPECHNSISFQQTTSSYLPRRRFSRTCPLNRRPVSEDMAQTMERQGAGKTIKRSPCACTEGEAFRLTVRRQPGTAASGSSLLSLYTTYVRVRASAGKAAWVPPPSSV